MAQTTFAFSMKACKVELSTNNSDYTDFSGFTSAVEVTGGERASGEAYTFDGDTPIITAGKRGPIDVNVTIIATETQTSDAYDLLMDRYETTGGGDLYVRYSPKGGASGTQVYTTGKGIVTAPGYPSGPAGDGKPCELKFTVKVPSITRSTS